MDASLVYSRRSEVSAAILKNSNDSICFYSVVLRSLNNFWLASPDLYHELNGYLSVVIPEITHLIVTYLNAHVKNHAQATRIYESDLAFCGLSQGWENILDNTQVLQLIFRVILQLKCEKLNVVISPKAYQKS